MASENDPGWRGVGWTRSIRSATGYRGGRTRRGREVPLGPMPVSLRIVLILTGILVAVGLVSLLFS